MSYRPRDENHAVRYFFLKTKRSFRDNVKDDLYAFWFGSLDAINSLARTIFGTLGTVLGLSSDICFNIQHKWVRTKNELYNQQLSVAVVSSNTGTDTGTDTVATS